MPLKTPNLTREQKLCTNVPSKFANATKWAQWHTDLKNCFGKDGANSLWTEAWNAYGSSSPSAKNSNLIQYMASQGVNIDDSLGDKAVLFGSGIAGFFGGYAKFGRAMTFLLAGGISVAFLILLYNIVNNPDKAKKSIGVITEGAMLATPQGRIASGATKALPR